MSGSSRYVERIDITSARPTGLAEYEHRSRYVWAEVMLGGGLSVLDVACGTGHGSEVLAARNSVTGIDREPSAIARARSRCAGAFIRAEVPPLPLEDDSCDIAVCFETIEHIEDDHGLLSELSRVIRPGGRLLISSPNQEISSVEGHPRNQFHIREYLLSELAALVAEHGFEVEGTFGQGPAARNLAQRVMRGLAWRSKALAGASRRLHHLIFARVLDRDVRPMGESERPAYWILDCRLVERRDRG